MEEIVQRLRHLEEQTKQQLYNQVCMKFKTAKCQLIKKTLTRDLLMKLYTLSTF